MAEMLQRQLDEVRALLKRSRELFGSQPVPPPVLPGRPSRAGTQPDAGPASQPVE